MPPIYWCPLCDEALEACPHRDDPAARRGQPCPHDETYTDSELFERCVYCEMEVR